jgi:hypothetical protein
MKRKQIEPLEMLLRKIRFDISEIDKFVSGEKYTAIMLKNKSIGICANVDRAINRNLSEYGKIDLEKIDHRIFINAYFNAKLNNKENLIGEDLLKVIDFFQYRNIVMIGNFHPIVAKFNKLGIKATIFDLKSDSPYLTPMFKQKDFLRNADSVILTATTIYNKTFMSIIESTPENCEIFLLGPSTPMHPEMLRYRNISHLFGTSFSSNDIDLINIIEEGKGPRIFLKHGKKTMLPSK